ncbi:uncharacterized protein LOC126899822 [Daktulosphaira vitifoliae]|uniref:uncharacterized protein LOC126899822 n=1 Tax=Daktulosphaira vitifoliae TaxID=58002 RepID=UPI0021AAF8FF|nr:uncharacterized protein LOC126899822 [Daktulosphaira vitifoliae]
MDSGKKLEGCSCSSKSANKSNQSKCEQPQKSSYSTQQTPCSPCPCPAEECKVTLKTVRALVEAENKDVELSELLSGITILDEHRPKKKILNMYDANSKINRVEMEHNVDPEYIAFIMKNIEDGYNLKTDPIEMYEHLFSKGNEEAPLVALGPTADLSNEDLVVPLSPPAVVNAKDPDYEKGSRIGRIIQSLNVTVAEATNIDNVDDLQVLIGGGTHEENIADSTHNEYDGGTRDLKLETRAPIQSAAVLRGSTPPTWFPGYNVALPNTAHPALVNDPATVLDEAWFHSQPLALNLDTKGAKLIGS